MLMLGQRAPAPPPGLIADDQLRLIFACCHPALDPGTRVALTLRTLRGLSTAEIASSFLVSEATLAILDELREDSQVGRWHLLHACRADLLRRLGRTADPPGPGDVRRRP